MKRDEQLESLQAIETELHRLADENPTIASRLSTLASRLAYQREQVADLHTQIEQWKQHAKDMAGEQTG